MVIMHASLSHAFHPTQQNTFELITNLILYSMSCG